MSLQPFFLPAEGGKRFCLLHTPPSGVAVRGAVVLVPPFAEELNCARRVLALQAGDFAAAGYAVLHMDLFGCGDSAGEFAEASWARWRADVLLAGEHLAARFRAPLWFWGLRAGCLLAAQAVVERRLPAGLLFWQPVLNGGQVLRHFLRLQLAGEALAGEKNEGSASLRQRLSGGETLEIGGYALTPALAAELEAASLPADLSARRIECIEMGDSLSPALERQLAVWQQQGCAVRGQAVPDPAFWLAPGIFEAPAWRQASLAALTGGAP